MAFVLMICLFLVAFWFITQAVLDARPASWTGSAARTPTSTNASSLLPTADSSGPQPDHSAHIMVRVLHGVELLFLAPLPFLVFLSLARYVQSFLKSDGQASSQDRLSGCGSQLHSVKTLVVSLMTASIATDLLRRAIENVSLPSAAAEGLVMLLLGSYWLGLELVCKPRCLPTATNIATK